MTHVPSFFVDDRLQQNLTECPEVFGGDFRQVLPLILRGSRPLDVVSYLIKYRFWSIFQVVKLTETCVILKMKEIFQICCLMLGNGRVEIKLVCLQYVILQYKIV